MNQTSAPPAVADLCRWLAVAVLATSWACSGDGIVAPGTATLILTTVTYGEPPDADGYTVSIDGGSVQHIATSGRLVWHDVASGRHSVELSDIAGTCASTGATLRNVTLDPGDTASVAFSIFCSEANARVTVSTRTVGVSFDPDGYSLSVDGGPVRAISDAAKVTLSELSPGTHSFTL